MRHPTIVDIARKLRIAPSTVSRALADHPDIRKETKERVQRTAKAMKYSPNPIARTLKSNQSTMIGVLVPEIKHDFFSSAISGIEEVAYQSGYTIIVCQSNESFEREVVNTNALMHARVAGIIASISQCTRSDDHFQDVLRRQIPLVFFDRVCEGVEASKVVIDDRKSACGAVSYLIGKGYRRIALLAGPNDLGICRLRHEGYVDALNRSQIPYDELLVRYGGLHEQDGYRSMDSLIRDRVLPEAIFAVNDPVAIGAFQRIKEEGLRIPTDVAIMGFSNNKITGLVDPPLTTVDQPSFQMGKTAAEILIGIIEDNLATPRTVVLDTTLIERGST